MEDMAMNDAESYWSPLCALVSQLRCWVHVAWKEGPSTREGWWGQLLAIPTKGYLEAAGGPILIRDVEWVEVSTMRIKGGIAGRPRKMMDVKEEILASLRATQLKWELFEATWSVQGLFDAEPVQVVRFVNPFGPGIEAIAKR
jgi:hypothetical protein